MEIHITKEETVNNKYIYKSIKFLDKIRTLPGELLHDSFMGNSCDNNLHSMFFKLIELILKKIKLPM